MESIRYNLKCQLLDNIRALYAKCMSAVLLFVHQGLVLSKWFDIRSGVRQGCVLSPLLFIFYMVRIAKEANPDLEANNELLHV